MAAVRFPLRARGQPSLTVTYWIGKLTRPRRGAGGSVGAGRRRLGGALDRGTLTATLSADRRFAPPGHAGLAGLQLHRSQSRRRPGTLDTAMRDEARGWWGAADPTIDGRAPEDPGHDGPSIFRFADERQLPALRRPIGPTIEFTPGGTVLRGWTAIVSSGR